MQYYSFILVFMGTEDAEKVGKGVTFTRSQKFKSYLI